MCSLKAFRPTTVKCVETRGHVEGDFKAESAGEIPVRCKVMYA